jgi:catechol 2,3-dioxygenase-like lactoylglutathione lyase family enzyme
VTDLPAALALYRDTLGWEEAWREGELTASLTLPGTDVQLMLDAHNAYVPGPIFFVDRVADFQREHRDRLQWRYPPAAIPGGQLGGFADASGNVVYVMDQAGD